MARDCEDRPGQAGRGSGADRRGAGGAGRGGDGGAPPPVNRLAIFDCDGTIVDSQHTICGAMEEAFAKAGLPAPARERTRRVVGLSLVEAMRAMLPDAEAALHASLAEDYKRAFHAMRGRGEVDEPLYEGIVELIQALDEGGWLLGVATGKSDRGLSL